MDKRYVILGLLLAFGLGYILYTYKRCDQPTQTEIAQAQLECAQALNPYEIAKAACLKIYQTESCEFKAEDEEAVMGVVFDYANKCAKEKLQSNNKCIDKYEDL